MRLADIQIALPVGKVEIESFREQFENFDLAVDRSGVTSKFVAGADETSLDLAVAAMTKLEARSPGTTASIDGLVFITQTPDYLFPGNSFLLIDRLGMKQDIVNFDVNQGCAGFVYGMHLAEAMLAAGHATTVALICSDTYSKLIGPDDRGTSLLFGDGCAVAILSHAAGPFRVVASKVKQLSEFNRLFAVFEGGARDSYRAASPHIEMQGAALLELLGKHAPSFVDAFLVDRGLTIADIDLVVCHQASRVALDRIERLLGIPPEKMFRNIEKLGNTTCASIPIALSEALFNEESAGKKRILVFGFGVGFAMGAALLERD